MTLSARLTSDIKTVFMNADQFATAFTNARTTLTINVIFDNEFSLIIEDVETTTPAITAADSDCIGVIHGDIFTNNTTTTAYNVISVQPDGTGMTTIILNKD